MAVNGKKYSYENIQVSLGGKPLAGANAISYKESTEHTNVHVLGSSEPSDVVDGARTYEGTLTLTYDEYDSIQDSIPKGVSVTQLAAFEITVTRLGAGNVLRTDVVKRVRFKELEKSFTAGEVSSTIEMPFTAVGIDYNV